MKPLTSLLTICLTFFSFLFTSAQEKNDLVKQYARDANRLDLQTNPDSIDYAYELHSKVLALNDKWSASYRSKISIDYKRGNLTNALITASSFVASLSEFGDSWVYLGIVLNKLNSRSSAADCFIKAITIYRSESEKTKNKDYKSELKFQIDILQTFLNTEYSDKKSETNQVKFSIKDAETVDDFVSKFMTYNGIQFF
jgi:tetratricopeptide (TPR) repeat protein